ncbi:MAG: J domain-containing protein [Chlorobi bacterium]|nr:J domain-containing protein [Chlorobiota bacterium]MCI0715387.1 J domain-containing protein [Chlorobiota bacterium]
MFNRKTPWEILDISPESDVSTIDNAWKNLVKKFHPDLVQTPEKKRKYTIKCAEINNARDEALKLTNSTKAQYYSYSRNIKRDNFKKNASLKYYKWIFVIIFMISFFIGIILLVNYVKGLPEENPLKIIISALTILFVTFFILGLCFLGIIDMLIFLIFVFILEKIGLSKYSFKLSWLIILLSNFIITFYYFDFKFQPHTPLNNFLGILAQTIAALTVPILFAIDWFKTFIKYKKLKKIVVAPFL